MIRVQRENFDVGAEIAAMSGRNMGALASFIGLVRSKDGDESISAMTLEHYPGMTEKKLAEIETEAHKRWALEDSLVIHRYGRLEPGEQIVLVITASSHRQAALESCAFLIDWLKTSAPFWKLEERGNGEDWVKARQSDDVASEKWTVKK